MLKTIQNSYYKLGAAVMVGLMSSAGDAMAQDNNFATITQNIGKSIQDFPGLVSAISYIMGTLLGVLGVMKIKDHVENPTQTQLKDGVIRLGAGGALFALPMLFDAMTNTIGGDHTDVPGVTPLNKANLGLATD